MTYYIRGVCGGVSRSSAVYKNRVYAAAAAAQHRHPRRREATVGRLCIVAAGLACLSLIVKFFAAHSGLFYRLLLDRRESREERNGSEAREREETPGKWRGEGEGEGWCVGVNGDGWLCGGGG